MHLIPQINPYHYDKLMKKLRTFFEQNKVIECYLNNRLTTFASCEQPESVVTFDYINMTWPMPQTAQVILETIILSEGENCKNGFYNVTNSFRNEQGKNLDPARYSLSFFLIDVEIPGNIEDLINFQKSLLQWLGFGDKNNYVEVNYMDMCEKYGVKELTHEHEALMGKEYGDVVFLKHFPEEESFFNMKRCDDPKLVKKVDVLLGSPNIKSMEVIGSGERSVDVDQMRRSFIEQTEGKFA